MWILATLAGGMILPTLSSDHFISFWGFAIIFFSCWLAIKALSILRVNDQKEDLQLFRKTFMHINAYALLVIICLSFGTLKNI